MAKYIDVERLNAALDKWVEVMADAEGDYSDGVRFAIQHFIFLLASLQQEQPEVDLEEEADRLFFSLGWYEGDHDQPMLDGVSLEEFRGIARHFYSLGLNARKEENK